MKSINIPHYIKYCISILMSIFLWTSCINESQVQDAKTINLSKIFKNKQKINLSKVATKIEYIQLQGDTTCYLGQIYRPNKSIKFFNDKILVRDAADKLLLFNTSGKFLNKIGNVGRGPHDYIKPDDFTFLKKNGDSLVVVFSGAQQKALIFTHTGNYIKSITIDFWPTGLNSINSSLVFINNIGRRKKSKYYTLSIVSTDGDLEKRLFYKENEKVIEENNKKLGLSGMYNNYMLKDTFCFWESNYDTIWRITEKLTIIPKYVIDIGGNKMPFREQTKSNIFDINKIKKYNKLTHVKESTRFFFFSMIYRARLHRIYYDKNTKESSCVEFKKESGNGTNLLFYNDIDGGLPFWPTGQVSDNKMYKLIYGYELKDYLDRKGDNVEVIDKVSREKLLQLAENSKVSDNPILMIVTLKQ